MKEILGKFHFRNSFATRICIWMMLMAGCVFMLSFFGASWYASKMMLKEGHNKANLELDKAILYVTGEMNVIENAGNNFSAFWCMGHHLSTDEAYAVCRDFLVNNPSVDGVAMAFAPAEYPAFRQGFCPYVMRGKHGEMIEQQWGDHSNYYKKEWYRVTKQYGKSRWSMPFLEEDGNAVCSYCIPIKTKDGRFLGVLAVDMSLENLTYKMQGIKPYAGSFISIMDREFNFLVHPDKKLILKGTPMQLLAKNKYEVNESIFVDMKNRKRGIGAFGEKGDQKFLYYAPVKRAGWTVTLECDKAEIVKGVVAVRWQMVFISLAGMLGLLFMSFFVMRKRLQPIRHYAKAAMLIAEGNFHTHLPKMLVHNELWVLGEALDHMQHSLDQYIQDLQTTTKEKGRIESELNIASKIQMAMIPKIFPPYPDRDDLDIYGTLIPAKAVGGDLYDFFLRDEKLFFCVGDVSGKGVPASLVMAVTRSLLRIVAVQESRPERIVASLNNSMSDMNDSNMFVTLFMGVLDLPTGRLRYCNAGHNAPVIINGQTHQVEMLSVKANLPVAILPDFKFEMQEVTIQPGTSIFMYTDGLTEAENQEKVLFGEDNMMEMLKKMQGKTAQEQIEGMLGAVHEHVGGAEQSDDLTMVSLKYLRQQQQTRFYRKMTLHNDIRETPRIADFMDDIVGETGIDTALASSLNLALEEAVVNVMNYAYPKDQVSEIAIETYADKENIKFVVTDSGVPFDPTKTTEPDITASLDDRAVGGLGIFLVNHLMDSVEYQRIGEENVLTLMKKLNVNK